MPCSRTSRSSRSAPAGAPRPSRSRASSCRSAVHERRLAEQLDRRLQRPLGVAQDQPRLGGPVPVVALQAHDGADGLAGRRGQLRARAEQHAARAGAARGEREGDVPALPHRPRVVEQRGRDEQRDGGVALAERGELLELLGERERERVARRDGVDAHLRPQVLGCEDARGVGGERLAEGRDVGALDGQARGGAVAAVALQDLGGGVQPAEQVEARDRAARARALGAVERDQHARAVVALGDARGDDADHARVPAVGRRARRRRPSLARRPGPRPRSGSASRRRGAPCCWRRARARRRGRAPCPRSAAARGRRRPGTGAPRRSVAGRAGSRSRRRRSCSGRPSRRPSARAGRACGSRRAGAGPGARAAGSPRRAARRRRRWRARRGRGPPRPAAGPRRRPPAAPGRACARPPRRTGPGTGSRRSAGARSARRAGGRRRAGCGGR